MAAPHPYMLVGPWYERERPPATTAAERASRPAIQKYVTVDFIDRLLADPRDSIAFDDKEDRWSYPVPAAALPPPEKPTPRQRLSPFRFVTTDLRKLYLPSHERFYAVVIELFCDEPGLPRPSVIDDVELGFVVRRRRVDFAEDKRGAVRRLSRALTYEWFNAELDPCTEDDLGLDVATDLYGALEAIPDTVARRRRFVEKHAHDLRDIGAKVSTEAWLVGPDGRGTWIDVEADPPAGMAEQEVRMVPIPRDSATCAPARSRSLWFGLVPTFSGELDANGAPKLDDASVYVVRCFARRRPEPGHEHCAPIVFWSAESEPYRLAPFFDPTGTKNRRIHVKLPDLRALAARAAEAGVPGGVSFERPAGSALEFGPVGSLDLSGTMDTSSTGETCTYAIELMTIVAMFVFSIFLPIVVFVFQLWWLLALRFCWPGSTAAIQALETYFQTAANTVPFPATATGVKAKEALDTLVGIKGVGDQLGAPGGFPADATNARELHRIIESPAPTRQPTPTPAPKPDDPLCAVGGTP